VFTLQPSAVTTVVLTSVFPNFYALLSGLLVISAWHIKTLPRYESIEYAVLDNETRFSSLWFQKYGVLRSVVQSHGFHVRVWTGFIGLRLWTRNCEHGVEAVGAMKFGDFCSIALQLTLFGTLVTHVPRVWEFFLTPATHN
jgi:hypothetical protein